MIHHDPRFGFFMQPVNNSRSSHISDLIQNQRKTRGRATPQFFFNNSNLKYHYWQPKQRHFEKEEIYEGLKEESQDVKLAPTSTQSEPNNQTEKKVESGTMTSQSEKFTAGSTSKSSASTVLQPSVTSNCDSGNESDLIAKKKNRPKTDANISEFSSVKDVKIEEPEMSKICSRKCTYIQSASFKSGAKQGPNVTPHENSDNLYDLNDVSDFNCSPFDKVKCPTIKRPENVPSAVSLKDDLECTNDAISLKMKENFYKILENHPEGIPMSNFFSKYKEEFGIPLSTFSIGFTSPREMVMHYPNIFAYEKTKLCQEWILFDARINPKKRTKENDSTWLPIMVLDNLATIAQDFPEGIKGEEVLKKYSERYGTEINWSVLGFDTISSFLVRCPSIKTKLKGDECIVFPKNWGKKKSDTTVVQSALPTQDEMKYLWKQYFKEDVCDPTFSFKKMELPNQQHIKIIFSDIHSPKLFWIQFHESNYKLVKLMYDLNIFYDEYEEEYTLDHNVIKPGLACAIKFPCDERWHRAKIMSVVNDSTVRVYYVDYGTVMDTPVSDLRALHKNFSEFPMFAVSATMYGIAPLNESGYTAQAASYLFDQFSGKSLYAQIVKVNIDDPELELLLCDTSKEQDVNVNEMMINKGFAIWSAAKTVVKKEKRERILDESSVQMFYQLFPGWLYESDENTTKDISNATDALDTCVRNEIAPLNLENFSCCKRHILRAFFQSNPVKMCKMWNMIISRYSTQLEDTLLNTLLEEIDAKDFQDKLLLRSCTNGNSKSSKSELKNCLNTQQENFVLEENMTFYNEKKSTDNSNVHIEKKLQQHRGDLNTSQRKKHRKKKTILEAVIDDSGSKLCLVLFKNTVCVVYQQLISLFAKGVPEKLIDHRLQSQSLEPDLVQITLKAHPTLYEEIGKFCPAQKRDRKNLYLLPLKQARRFLEVIAPSFNKRPYETIEHLANDCHPDHEYWFETEEN
ncbi:uncharacterized protein LOC106672109 isoform X2 [Cimex lectularius]|uniref:Tudor domain-containing protein n=1 Tax=Cimex lectularius TaxID=79782 RepID=A0A8I6TLT1_CIMLE|nr:uncharacterized protein LOC106672109 isoform X2 [Cimex lectularius]